MDRLLVFVGLGAACLLVPLKASGMWMAAKVFQTAADALPAEPGVQEQDLVFVNTVSMLTSYPAILRAHSGEPVPRRMLILGHIRSNLELTRLDERSVRVQAEGGFLATPTEALLRGKQPPFVVGEHIRRGPMTVTVEAVTEDGRPDSVIAAFDRPLEDPSLRWLVWTEADLRPFPLPAVGTDQSVPYRSSRKVAYPRAPPSPAFSRQTRSPSSSTSSICPWLEKVASV
jgi:hypothetical protein